MRRDVGGETVLQGGQNLRGEAILSDVLSEDAGKENVQRQKRGINGYARSRKEATSTRKMESCR